MNNYSHIILQNSPMTSKSNTSQQSFHSQTRLSRIRDKRTVYPESTLSKIVFITNSQGNGFRRQYFLNNEIPNYIDLEKMIEGINKVCYAKWKQNFQLRVQQPLQVEQKSLKLLGLVSVVIMCVFIYLVYVQSTSSIQWLLYSFVLLLLLICAISLKVAPTKRVDVNKDLEMVKTIKKELVRLNEQELKKHSVSARFTWTCHVDCLWIACEFH